MMVEAWDQVRSADEIANGAAGRGCQVAAALAASERQMAAASTEATVTPRRSLARMIEAPAGRARVLRVRSA